MLTKTQMDGIYVESLHSEESLFLYDAKNRYATVVHTHKGKTGRVTLTELLAEAEAFAKHNLPEEPKLFRGFCCCPRCPASPSAAAQARAEAIRLIGKRCKVEFTAKDGGRGSLIGFIRAVAPLIYDTSYLCVESANLIPLDSLVSVEEIKE